MSLTEERQAMLRERIRAGLPIEPDGSIYLSAAPGQYAGREATKLMEATLKRIESTDNEHWTLSTRQNSSSTTPPIAS